MKNVEVSVYEESNLMTAIATTKTDASGAYFFEGLPFGQAYVIGVETPAGYKLVEKGTDPDQERVDSDVDPLTGFSDSYDLIDCDSYYRVLIGLKPL